ncbi:MAG: DUF4145 domain-containing protein [Hadesarchaea archaeon]|nr:DUF4145 domain-containing protein [Hadesarchaea archaeon]
MVTINDKFIKTRLDSLIEEGNNLLMEIPPVDIIEPLHQKQDNIVKFDKWKLSCLNFLLNVFGPNHYFLEKFKESTKHGWKVSIPISEHQKIEQPIYYSREQVSKCYAVLLFIKEQVDLGLVSDAQHLYDAELFSNLIEQAFELLRNDYKHAAAIYGRLVMENAIRDLCRLNKIQKEKLSEMLIELRRIGIIDLPKERIVQANYDIGSLAAHGKEEFNRYTNNDIEEMLVFIRDKIITLK